MSYQVFRARSCGVMDTSWLTKAISVLLENWYEYLPSLFSIFLIRISHLFSNILKRLVQDYVSGDQQLDAYRDIIEEIALDWGDRLGFITAALASIISVVALYANTQNRFLFIGMVAVVFLIYLVMQLKISALAAGEMVNKIDEYQIKIGNHVFKTYYLTFSEACNLVLIGINCIMLVAIFIAKWLNMPSIPQK